jgi:hypothetical protein
MKNLPSIIYFIYSSLLIAGEFNFKEILQNCSTYIESGSNITIYSSFLEVICHNLYYLSATDRNFRIYDRVPDIYLTNNTRLFFKGIIGTRKSYPPKCRDECI